MNRKRTSKETSGADKPNHPGKIANGNALTRAAKGQRVKKAVHRLGSDGESTEKINIAAMEKRSWAGRVLFDWFGPFAETPPDFWAHRTSSLIVLKLYKHFLGTENINPKEMCDLLKSLGSNLKADVNKHREKMGDAKRATDEEAKNFAGQLERVIQQIYGVKLKGV